MPSQKLAEQSYELSHARPAAVAEPEAAEETRGPWCVAERGSVGSDLNGRGSLVPCLSLKGLVQQLTGRALAVLEALEPCRSGAFPSSRPQEVAPAEPSAVEEEARAPPGLSAPRRATPSALHHPFMPLCRACA